MKILIIAITLLASAPAAFAEPHFGDPLLWPGQRDAEGVVEFPLPDALQGYTASLERPRARFFASFFVADASSAFPRSRDTETVVTYDGKIGEGSVWDRIVDLLRYERRVSGIGRSLQEIRRCSRVYVRNSDRAQGPLYKLYIGERARTSNGRTGLCNHVTR